MNRSQIREMLMCDGDAMEELFQRAAYVKQVEVGESLYLRGLIEYSNRCQKNCLYCGIRAENDLVLRYSLTEDEVLTAAREALERGYGSVVLQGGELTGEDHIARIEHLLHQIKHLSESRLGVTLSLGEQSQETYRRWFEAGAHRYLLRIEASNPELYRRIHPDNKLHSYEKRVEALHNLRAEGYQVGTGVMIGLPTQTIEHLVDDILFMRDLDVDMCGMGPYIEAENTPLTNHLPEQAGATTREWRLRTTLKMIATLRLVMPTINIAATTALSSLSADGRLRAVQCGANILMPNLTPDEQQSHYHLYNDKTSAVDPRLLNYPIGYEKWGDAPHFQKRVADVKK